MTDLRVTDRFVFAWRSVWVRLCRRLTLVRLRRLNGRRKVRVAFLVSELAKWKAQTVFDRMRESEVFEPFVAVHNLTRLAALPEDEQRRLVAEKLAYFRARGMAAVDIQRYGSRQTLSVERFGADIVFYQQPWDLASQLRPWTVARRALTFYIPYALPNHDMIKFEIGHKLHRFVQGHVVLNDAFAAYYREKEREFGGAYAARYLPLGHPVLDGIRVSSDQPGEGKCVIYAPHWTLEYGDFHPELKYGTFAWNGREILRYAEAHPHVKWVFKPHPELRDALVRSGFMSAAEVDSYYAAWERLGTACYTSDYLDLFDESTAMITDSGSFLTEYGCTGKPLIRPVNETLNVSPHPLMGRLYSTYFEVRNMAQLQAVLDRVIVAGDDPMRRRRLEELGSLGLRTHDAGTAIMRYLETLVRK